METRIKEILKSKGMTSAQLSELTGISRANISLIINGKVDANIRTFDRIARALQVSLPELLQAPSDTYSEDVHYCPYCGKAIPN